MKNLAVLLILISWAAAWPTTARACSVCGCGAGGYYMGLMPLFSKNYVGLRWRQVGYTSHAGGDPAYDALTKQTDVFNTIELVNRIYATPRLQISTFVPYQLHRQQTTSPSATHSTGGLGDALATASYNVLTNLADTNEPLLRHSLWVGVGIKAATGRYQVQTQQQVNAGEPNYLLGTGSWDPMLTANYMVRKDRTGLSLDLTARYATTNRHQYAFGNRATGTLSVFTIRQRQGWGYMPNASLYAEATGAEFRNGYKLENTGGNLLCAQAGLDVLVRQATVGVLGSWPVAQHLGGGLQKAQNRWLVHLGWAF